jgi:hypothetical protein
LIAAPASRPIGRACAVMLRPGRKTGKGNEGAGRVRQSIQTVARAFDAMQRYQVKLVRT